MLGDGSWELAMDSVCQDWHMRSRCLSFPFYMVKIQLQEGDMAPALQQILAGCFTAGAVQDNRAACTSHWVQCQQTNQWSDVIAVC